MVNVYLSILAGFPLPGIKFSNKFRRVCFKAYALGTDLHISLWAVSYLYHALLPEISLTEKCQNVYVFFNIVQVLFLTSYFRLRRLILGRTLRVFLRDKSVPERGSFKSPLAQKANIITLMLVLGEGMSGTLWSLLVLVPAIQELHGGRYFVTSPSLPFDPYISPYYELMAVLQAVGFLHSSLKVCAFYNIFLHTGCDLLVRYRELRASLPSCFVPGQGRGQLVDWIKKHQEVMRLGATMQEAYSPVLLIHFLFQLLIICGTTFVFAQGLDRFQMSISVSYTLVKACKVFFLCRLGDHIEFESDRITDDIGDSQWFDCSGEMKKMLVIILTVSKKNLKLSAFGGSPLSSETFRSIIASAYSYYLFLDQLKK